MENLKKRTKAPEPVKLKKVQSVERSEKEASLNGRHSKTESTLSAAGSCDKVSKDGDFKSLRSDKLELAENNKLVGITENNDTNSCNDSTESAVNRKISDECSERKLNDDLLVTASLQSENNATINETNTQKAVMNANDNNLKQNSSTLTVVEAKTIEHGQELSDENDAEDRDPELEFSSINLDDIFPVIELPVGEVGAKTIDSVEAAEKPVTPDSDAATELLKSSTSLSTSLSSLPNNSVSCRNSKAASPQPETSIILRAGSVSSVSNSDVASGILPLSLRQSTNDDINTIPFRRVQEQNSKYGGLSPPRIRRSSNFSNSERKVYAERKNSLSSSQDASWTDSALVREHKKLKEMFDALQPSFHDKDVKPEAKKIEDFMRQLHLVNKMAIEFKNTLNHTSKLTAYGTAKRRPALDKYSFQPLKYYDTEIITTSSLPYNDSILANCTAKATYQSSAKVNDASAGAINDEALTKKFNSKPSNEVATKAANCSSSPSYIPKWISKERNALSVESPQKSVVHLESPSSRTSIASPKPSSFFSETPKTGLQNRNQMKSLWKSPEVQKSWITNTVRLGSATKNPDEKLLAYQKIRQEIEMEARRQLELEEMRSKTSTNSNQSVEESRKQLSKNMQSYSTHLDNKRVSNNKPSAVQMTVGFTAKPCQESIESTTHIFRPTRSNLNENYTENKFKRFNSSSVKKDGEDAERTAYVYCSPVVFTGKHATDVEQITEKSSNLTSPKLRYKLSTNSSKPRTSSEDNCLCMLKQTDQYIGKEKKSRNDCNITRVCVNGSPNSIRSKVATKMTIEVTPSSFTTKTPSATSQQQRHIVLRSPITVRSATNNLQNSFSSPIARTEHDKCATVHNKADEKLSYNLHSPARLSNPKTISLSHHKTKMAPSIPITDGTFELPPLRKVEMPTEKTGFQLGTVLEDKKKPATSTTPVSRRNADLDSLCSEVSSPSASQPPAPPPPPPPPPPPSLKQTDHPSQNKQYRSNSNILTSLPPPPLQVSAAHFTHSASPIQSPSSVSKKNYSSESNKDTLKPANKNLPARVVLDPTKLMEEIKKVQLKPATPIQKLKVTDAREDLLEEIRKAGGIKSLKKRPVVT